MSLPTKDDDGAIEVEGPGHTGIKFTGLMGRQALLVLGMAFVAWYVGYSRPQAILQELHAIRVEVVKSNITTQAIVESMPPQQQRDAKKAINERLAVLSMADQNLGRP